MQPLHVVLLQSDSGTAKSLIASMQKSFRSIRQATSLYDVRNCLAKQPQGIVILDMEIASIFEVQELSHNFPEVRIICNHRLADERMWTAALGAGADDCCPSHDTRGILRAALQSQAARMAA
jgi:DNA-binding NarL/FixJ family response regulator